MNEKIDVALKENQNNIEKRPVKAEKKAVDDYLTQMKLFEEDRIELAKKSAKTAWQVAAGFGGLALCSLIVLVVMMPLKQTQPYLLKVDQTTGHTEIVQPLSDAKQTTYGEVLDKYWLNKYIILICFNFCTHAF